MYQPVSRKTMGYSQKAEMLRNNIHQERSASAPRYNIDREIVCPKNGPKRWLNRNIRTACSMSRDCFKFAGMNQSTDALNLGMKLVSILLIDIILSP